MKTRQLNTVPTGRRYLYLAMVVILLTSVIGSTYSPQEVKAQENNYNNNVYLPIVMNSSQSTESQPIEEELQATSQPSLIFPFESTNRWYVKQGYDIGTHVGYQKYSFDLMIEGDTNGNLTEGKSVLSPVAGTLVWTLDRYYSMVIQAGKNSSGKYQCVLVAHSKNPIPFTPGITQVSQGQRLGDASCTGCDVGIPAHIHMTYFTTTDSSCSNSKSGQPFHNLEREDWTYPDNQGRYAQAWQNTVVWRGMYCPISPGQGAGNRSFLYQQAYDRNGGVTTLGCVSNEVHDWGYGMYLQDFPGVGVYGNGAIVHDQGHDIPYGTIYAYVVHGDLWDKYTQGSNAVAMGPPTSDQYTSPLGRTQQSFFHGYINWTGTLWKLNYWPSSGTGFRIEYRNARNFSSGPTYVVYKAIPADPNKKLDLNWGSGAPGTGKFGVWADNFSLKATTNYTFQQGKHVFWVQADDGVRLYVNGQLIIDEWHPASNGNYYAYYTFPSQGTYSVRLEYYDQSGNAYVNLDWWKY